MCKLFVVIVCLLFVCLFVCLYLTSLFATTIIVLSILRVGVVFSSDTYRTEREEQQNIYIQTLTDNTQDTVAQFKMKFKRTRMNEKKKDCRVHT